MRLRVFPLTGQIPGSMSIPGTVGGSVGSVPAGTLGFRCGEGRYILVSTPEDGARIDPWLELPLWSLGVAKSRGMRINMQTRMSTRGFLVDERCSCTDREPQLSANSERHGQTAKHQCCVQSLSPVISISGRERSLWRPLLLDIHTVELCPFTCCPLSP